MTDTKPPDTEPPVANPRASWAASRDQAIADFLDRFADSPDRDLLADIMVTLTRLAREGAERGDLKLLTSAFMELRYAFKVFAPYRHIRKVSIFGSSRTPAGHPDYVQAESFAQLMRLRSWMVITGAGEGIMGAGQAGAGRAASFGVAIRLPHEQRTNEVIQADPKLINFKYFFTRKLLFMKEAKAVALFPGGFGTQDEGFEVMTLVQTGKATMLPIVLLDAPGGTYWQHWRTYVKAELLHSGMISAEDMHLFKLTDDVEVAVQEILRFYRRFHSYRYVKERLVIRLKEALPNEALAHIRGEFADVLDGGTIEQCRALPEENGELADLPRLMLQFNRRSLGRLRQMLDYINGL
jgi:uncharacterized protein (TIGR00730 family)